MSGSSIVALGHLNPLIFRPEWLRDKEIAVGSDFEGINIDIVHPELVVLRLPWGQMQVDRERFFIGAVQEPLIRACDFFVKCFQELPETPMNAVGLNRDVHFPSGSEKARNHVGDMLAPKDFWTDFLFGKGGRRAGGLRSLLMEQSILVNGRQERLDGLHGWIQVKVEPSVKSEIPHGIYVQVNDHYDLTQHIRSADGKSASALVSEKWEDSIRNSEHWIDKIMELAGGT
jgi:hypothetical protein